MTKIEKSTDDIYYLEINIDFETVHSDIKDSGNIIRPNYGRDEYKTE